MSSNITVVMNGYKRPHYFEQQLVAIQNQTAKPDHIMLWQNKGDTFDPNLTSQTMHASSNYNFGVWARFAYALNAKTEYVCVFDDDTIPGNRWFENCLNTLKTHDGLLGTIGVIFHDSTYRYGFHHRVGWDGGNDVITEVDIVGHSWFFRREWLSHFWRELPRLDTSYLVGEDIHFSAMLQKYGGKKTFVPSHPLSDRSLWGSLPEFALKYGGDNVAISQNGGHPIMGQALQYEISNGYKPIFMRGK